MWISWYHAWRTFRTSRKEENWFGLQTLLQRKENWRLCNLLQRKWRTILKCVRRNEGSQKPLKTWRVVQRVHRAFYALLNALDYFIVYCHWGGEGWGKRLLHSNNFGVVYLPFACDVFWSHDLWTCHEDIRCKEKLRRARAQQIVISWATLSATRPIQNGYHVGWCSLCSLCEDSNDIPFIGHKMCMPWWIDRLCMYVCNN